MIRTNTHFKKIHDVVKQLEFSWQNPIDINNTETNTLFVGSSTNTFLPKLADISEEGNHYYTIQPCIKTHNLKLYRMAQLNKQFDNLNLYYNSFFQMFGTIKKGCLTENDIEKYFYILNKLYNIEDSGIVIVTSKKFEQFKKILEGNKIVKKLIFPNDDNLTKWSYGLNHLSGSAIIAYTKRDETLLTLFDIVEIIDKKTNTNYVEFCFGIDNIDEDMNSFYYNFGVEVKTISYVEFIFYDSLIIVCELFLMGIGLPIWSYDYQKSHVFKRYIKYLIASKSKLKYSDEVMYRYIETYLEKNFTKIDIEKVRLYEIIKQVEKNMKVSEIRFKKYSTEKKLTEKNLAKIEYDFGVIRI